LQFNLKKFGNRLSICDRREPSDGVDTLLRLRDRVAGKVFEHPH